ncbi:hypothetical protein L6164_025385 [Bauhinia variegata]|uniref:Uncharacterized protein n=1 Tax=Bauhinia variegata TaxID=167791 RepID=A0ACB9M0S9_BAUVA|nr:hypothetical protein L6164_025385 [Bauhinia variegata]
MKMASPLSDGVFMEKQTTNSEASTPNSLNAIGELPTENAPMNEDNGSSRNSAHSPSTDEEPAMVEDAPARRKKRPINVDDEIPALKISVMSQDGKVLHFKIRHETRLVKLLLAFCYKKDKPYSSMRFLYDGKRISPRDTPKKLGMKDGDQIDAMTDQDGGGCKGCSAELCCTWDAH